MTIVHGPYKYVLNNLKPVYRCDKNLTTLYQLQCSTTQSMKIGALFIVYGKFSFFRFGDSDDT